MIDNETGIVAICTGSAIFMFGAILMFDKALMVAGNLIIIIGMLILIKSKVLSLIELDKMLGLLLFILGVFSLVMRYVMLGFILEMCGMIYIFKQSIPSFRSVFMKLIYGKVLRD